jgi:hypothetical protein
VDKDQKTYELIDAYLRDELKIEDLDMVKYRIRTEPDFADQVELQKAIIRELQVAREAQLRSVLKERGQVNYIKNMWSTTWLRASAAIIIAFVAMFVIVKFFVPQSGVISENNNQSKEITSDNEPAEEEVSAIDSATNNVPVEGQLESAEEVSPDEITEETLKEEEGNVTQNAKDNTANVPATTESENLERLKKAEDKLDVNDDVEVKTDKMVLAQKVNVLMLDAPIKTTQTTGTYKNEELKDVSVKKGKDKKKENQTETEAPTATDYDKVTFQSRQQDIELWQSIVNFRGYMWDKQTLILYDIQATEALLFKEIGGQLYMKRGNKYYQIKRSSKFEPYVVLTDPAILKSLQ